MDSMTDSTTPGYSHLAHSRAGLAEIESKYIAAGLLRKTPAVSPKNTNLEVHALLGEHHDLVGLPVVEDGKPVGLINRNIFMDGMAKPYRPELYNKKSCIAFMDKEPLIVGQDMSIQELSLLVAGSSGKTLKDGFIITDHAGNYLGLGTGEDLVRMISYLQAEKNRLVMESISYASVIQKSFQRASNEDLVAVLQDYFVHWEPRDKVGGDYYFCKKFADGFFLALFDCTGHGVPGAFMTLIMAAFLEHILREENRFDPAAALAMMNKKVKVAMGQVGDPDIASHLHEQSDDGMDTAFCWVGLAAGKLVYAGAKIPLFYIENGTAEASALDGDKKGVGYIDTPMDYAWTNREIKLSEGMCLYLTTDGLTDQIGGPKHIAFGKRRLMGLIRDNAKAPMPEQAEILMRAFREYQGEQRRRDDVSVIGFRV
jgi:sigma-B regulation protein RsbU (phosphoserine phosphatase)